MWLALWWCLSARAEDLPSLLARGPVALVETKADGRVSKVTAIAKVAATPDAVWAKLTAFQDYTAWMPQVVKSDVLSQSDGPPKTVVVDWSIAAPGPNIAFTATYTLDEAAHTIDGAWQSGALKGSAWSWRLVADGSGTMVYRESYSAAVADNWLLTQFDDSAHTLELGLNAATPIVEVQALEKALQAP